MIDVDAKGLKILRHRLLTGAHSSRNANGAAELRERTTETIIEAGEHFSLHHGRHIGSMPFRW
ncbi:hypothetical protein AVM02_01900 [Brucella anthropi]